MIFLSFSKVFKFFFTIFLLFIFSSVSLYSQTIIKEKVGIKPKEKIKFSQLNKTSSTESLWVQVVGQSDWSAVLEGPCGVGGSAEGQGGTIKYISIENPPVGTYRLRITQYFPDAVPGYLGPGGDVQYAAGYTGFSKDSASFSYSSAFQWADGQTSRTSEFTFDLNYINDYEIQALGYFGTTCGETNSIIRVKRFEEVPDCDKNIRLDSEPNPVINLSIQSQTGDLVFRDLGSGLSLGRTTTIRLNQGSIGLMFLPSFRGTSETATVTTEINGVIRTINVDVFDYSPYDSSIYTDENNVYLIHNEIYKNIIFLDYDVCHKSTPLDSVTFNLNIISGNFGGHIKDPVTGVRVDSLINLANTDGEAEFEFIADGITQNDLDTVVIRITTTDPSIEPYDVIYYIKSTSIQVTFNPPSIAPGDTANVILKKKYSNGSLSDFPQDQQFDIKLTEGAGYGTMFIPEEDYMTDRAYGVMQGFKFIANEQITGTPVSSTLLVKTSSGGVSTSIGTNNTLPVKNKSLTNKHINWLNKTASTLEEDEQLWGEGTIEITNDGPKIKIILTGESQVWPYKTSGNPITNAKINVTNGNQPMANQSVRITIMRIDRSGGHDHPNSSDLTLWGRISVNGVRGNPVTTDTDQNGEITTEEICASEFGGDYFIEAYLEASPEIIDKVNLQVRVPGLHLLPASNHYDKIGGTDKHYGPPSNPVNDDDHNHWGTNKIIKSIEAIADSFQVIYNDLKLRINDISLIAGGGFDINGNWEEDIGIHCKELGYGHCGHRSGNNADISFGVEKNGVHNPVPLDKYQHRDLFNIIMYNYGSPYKHKDHYHLQ